MDKLKSKKTKSNKPSSGSFITRLAGGKEDIGGSVFIHDLGFFTLGFLFSRCHLLFGAYPLGIALLSLLPHSVIPALAGGILGSLTLGNGGIVMAAIYITAVILRILLSPSKSTSFFGEALLTRMSVGTVSGFVAAVSEVITRGLSATSVLYGLTMIFLPPLAVFALSGLFGDKINLGIIFSSPENPLSKEKRSEKERFDIIFFEISATLLCFLTALSLCELVFFGISLSYIFINFVTILSAKRFGALRAGILGFVSSLGVAGISSASFALSGLGAGAFFSLGTGYALAVGLGASSLWGYYTAGLSGLLSTLPEYMISAALVSPLLGGVKKAEVEVPAEDTEKSAAEMVGTVALTYGSRYSRCLDLLEMSLASLAGVISDYSATSIAPSAEEYRALVVSVAEEHCKNCTGRKFCMIENIRPCMAKIDLVVEKLTDNIKICSEDINGDTEFCQKAEAVADSINERVAKAEEAAFKRKDRSAADEYSLISKLINEARCRDEEEKAVNSALTDTLTGAITRAGFEGGVIRAFGTRHKHIILAGEDEGGEKITSPAIRSEIEAALGIKLASPEYFRRGKMALMECDTARSFSVSSAKCSEPGEENEVSGDTVSFFETGEDSFCALISDGMGRGAVAKETSLFVSDFLTRALDFGGTKETVLHILNHIIRKKGEECSATVDLFEIDLLSGEATFIKSGAAPSFVKRDSSLFRIKSQTAPIGLMSGIDTERIKVEIKEGDFVIMLSDGIAESAEDAPWLIELIANSNVKTPELLATEILGAAKKNNKNHDDMSVAVIKINQL